jgi:hypothetical protein
MQIMGSLNLSDTIRTGAMLSWINPRAEDKGGNLYSLYNIVNESNRRGSNSTNAFDRELGLLQHIEALYEHEISTVRKAA